jgi:predicted AAA+ superfamily ATPase
MTHPEWKLVIDQLAAGKVAIGKAKSALERKQARHDKREIEFGNMCREVAAKALDEYNKETPLSYKVIFDKQRGGIGFSNYYSELSLSVRLRTSTGSEPDEEWLDGDEKDYENRVRPFIEKVLQEAQIPIAFARLSVPVHYYMK